MVQNTESQPVRMDEQGWDGEERHRWMNRQRGSNRQRGKDREGQTQRD